MHTGGKLIPRAALGDGGMEYQGGSTRLVALPLPQLTAPGARAVLLSMLRTNGFERAAQASGARV